MSSPTTFECAIWLAAQGIPCFPCWENKAPATPHGFKDATTDQTVLKQLCEKYPGTLVGVPTGTITGIDVLDIDPQNGGDKWLANASLPLSQTHCTRNGGMHILFKHMDGVRNSAGRIAPGVDVRGDGGYIIWWPFKGLNMLHNGMLAQWPQWLMPKLLPPPPSFKQHPPRKNDRAARLALRNAAISVAAAMEGTRNDKLNAAVFSLGEFVRRGDLSPEEIAVALIRVGRDAGLSRMEIVGTVASALRAVGV